ncbi:hypothetical protein [Allokutzneria oryzae]|uniref:Uncharacterized protein n=1 Tax=Allokutzneria oryzae TaxID=1378989 RepID=A0ABV6A965_9PSEU
MRATTLREAAARVLTGARRAVCLVLIGILALTGGVGVAAAAPTPILRAQADGVPEPLEPEDAGLPELESLVNAFNESVAALQRRAQDLAGKKKSLEERVNAVNARKAAHNEKVASLQARIKAHNDKPHVFVLPRQAAQKAAYDAEAAQLNAERAQLNTERAQGATEESQLRAEQSRLQTEAQSVRTAAQQLQAQAKHLRQRIKAARQARLTIRPPAAQQAPGGDPVRRASPRGGARDNGGDQASRKANDAALDQYAKDNGVTVEKGRFSVRLTPETVSGLPPKVAAKLSEPTRVFDGLELKPNGNYKALYTGRSGQIPKADQRAFHNAIERGGKATTTLKGKEVTIDEVGLVPTGGRRPPQWTPSNDGADHLRREIDQAASRFPKINAAADRTVAAAEFTASDGTKINLRAISGKDSVLDDKGVKIEGSSRAPADPRFPTKEVGGVPRDVDAEAKILEDLHRRLPTDAKGKLSVVVDYPAGDKLPAGEVVCSSCQGVLRAFGDEHRGITIEVRDMVGRLLLVINP